MVNKISMAMASQVIHEALHIIYFQKEPFLVGLVVSISLED